jgi:cell cycle arrest protein BUB2
MPNPNAVSAGRRPVINKKPIAADALSLDRLIRDGPPDGDLVGALESMRLKILDQGIKSDSDGMVRATSTFVFLFANNITVICAHLCLADSSQRARSRNRLLPHPHPPWSFARIF